MQVFDILQYELINYPDDLGDEVTETQDTKYKYVAQSELHKILVRPRLVLYNDMIGWALQNVDISTRSICNSQKVAVGSFRLEPSRLVVQFVGSCVRCVEQGRANTYRHK
jgi:hypothetical protein